MDVTESKLAKEELETARGFLETKVAERTHDLERANQSLLLEVGERRQSEAARVKLLSQLVTAQEFERRRLARDLHDQLGQQLTALRLKLESLKEPMAKGRKVNKEVDELLKITSQLDSDIEFLAWQLRPAALDDLGLAAALRNYTKRWSDHAGVTAEFHTRAFDVRPAPEVENNLYRIAQEALNNIAKHAVASRVDVILERRDNYGLLIIEDNGIGFEHTDQPDDRETMGVSSMRERAAVIGGTLEIESTPEKGTSVFVRVPLETARGKDA